MNKIAAGALLALGTVNAAERYIVQYDNAAWNSLHINSLPENTVHVLQHLQMTVVDLTSEEVAMFENVPGVKLHKDGPVEIFKSGVQENPKNWGLDRIDQHDLPLNQKFAYGNEGEGVDAYIVDTGVHATHQEFEGRATQEKNFAGDGRDDDCNGHGTHVASTIGGATVGIAKKAKIHGVKVLSCSGSGSWSGVIAGINYVTGTQVKNPQQKSVLNMSLGGGKQEIINAAVEASVKAGVTVVVAAGNESSDACFTSPASSPNAITVAASDRTDKPAYFTNYGKCTHIYGPGVDIYGAWPAGGSNDGYRTISGTSMASPHVAGVATLILAAGGAKTPAEVKAKLVEVSSKGKINPVNRDTPNNLLYADPNWTQSSNSNSGFRNTFKSLNNLN